MTQGFNKYWSEQSSFTDRYKNASFEAYEAGAASRQAEIDLLEKEIIETQQFLNNQNCIKQAEIDELKRELETLQGMHNAVSLTAGELIGERDELQRNLDYSERLRNNQFEHLKEITAQRDMAQRVNRELQKRINLALSAVWNDKCSHTIIDILKGEQNEK